MARPPEREIVRALIERHGCTFTEELGIPVQNNTPSPLFRLLFASLLFSARIGAPIATNAARALAERGWTTPQKMADSTPEERASS